MESLWYVSLAETKKNLINAGNYGAGLDVRRKAKGLSTNEETVKRHEESYQFWLDLFVYKTLRNEGVHWPISQVKPRWEAEIMYDWWEAYFSYSWQGAKKQ